MVNPFGSISAGNDIGCPGGQGDGSLFLATITLGNDESSGEKLHELPRRVGKEGSVYLAILASVPSIR